MLRLSRSALLFAVCAASSAADSVLSCGLTLPAYLSDNVQPLAQAPAPPLAPGDQLERAQAAERSKVVAGNTLPVIEWGRGSFGRVVPATLVVASPLTAFEKDLGGAHEGPLQPGAPAPATAAYKQLLRDDGAAELPPGILDDLGRRIARLHAAKPPAQERCAEEGYFIDALIVACELLRQVVNLPVGTKTWYTKIKELDDVMTYAQNRFEAWKDINLGEAEKASELDDADFLVRQYEVLEKMGEKLDAQASLLRETALSAVACSALAPCPAETPVMATIGAVRTAAGSTQLAGALVEPVFVSRVTEDAASLGAIFSRRAGNALARPAWARYSDRVSLVPAAAAAAAGAAGARAEQLRMLDAIAVMVQQTLAGLWHLEARGMQHFDLKPDNIMLAAGAGTVKLVDLGMACLHRRAWSADPATRRAAHPPGLLGYDGCAGTGKTMDCGGGFLGGTRTYMSPALPLRWMVEVVLGSGGEQHINALKPALGAYLSADPAPNWHKAEIEVPSGDTFAVGVMLLEALTGGRRTIDEDEHRVQKPATFPVHTVGLALVRYLALDDLTPAALANMRKYAPGAARDALRARVRVRALNVLRATAVDAIVVGDFRSPLHRAGDALPVAGLALLNLDDAAKETFCVPDAVRISSKTVRSTLSDINYRNVGKIDAALRILFSAAADAERSQSVNGRRRPVSVVPLRLTLAGKRSKKSTPEYFKGRRIGVKTDHKCSKPTTAVGMASVDDADPKVALAHDHDNAGGTLALLDLLANLLSTGLRPGLAPEETTIEALMRSVDGVRVALYAQFAKEEAADAPPQLPQSPQKKRRASDALPRTKILEPKVLPPQALLGQHKLDVVNAQVMPQHPKPGDAERPLAAAAAALAAHLACVRSCEHAATATRALLQHAADAGTKPPEVKADEACAGAAAVADAADGELAAAKATVRCRDAFDKLYNRRVLGVRMTEALSGPGGITAASASAVCRLTVCGSAHKGAVLQKLDEDARSAKIVENRVHNDKVDGMWRKKTAAKKRLDEAEMQTQMETFIDVFKSPVRGRFKDWSRAKSHTLQLYVKKLRGDDEKAPPRPMLAWRRTTADYRGTWVRRPLAVAEATRGAGPCSEMTWDAGVKRAMSLTSNPCGTAPLSPLSCQCIGIMRAATLPAAASVKPKDALALRLLFPTEEEQKRFVDTATKLLGDYHMAMADVPAAMKM